MMAIEKGRGRFVWFDLITTDVDAGRAFYAQVIGWGDELFGDDYHMFKTADGTIGGVGALPADAKAAGAAPHWIGYIGTPDVDWTTDQAQSLGARVLVPPTDIPTIGRFSMLVDPQGATFAAFTSIEDAPGHEGAARMGEIGWHELMTPDPEAALAFYGALFGWTLSDTMDMGPEFGKYYLFKRPGAKNSTGGIMKHSPSVPHPTWLYYVRVPSTAAAIEDIKAAGGTIVYGPQEVPDGGIVASAIDPQGAAFAVVEFGNAP